MKRELVWGVISCIFIIGLCIFPILAASADENTVGLWLFDEGSGSVAKDSSGNGNDGDIVEAQWAAGKFGTALEFDGIGGNLDYVAIPASESLNVSEAYSVEAWVFIDAHQNDNVRIVNALNADASGGYTLRISQTGSKVAAVLRDGGGLHTGATTVPVEEWAHVAFTYDGQTVKLYLNGEVDYDAPIKGAVKPPGLEYTIYIGRNNPETDPETPDGKIDEVRISNVARTQDEIQEAMEGLASATSVKPLDKLATTWGTLKKL